MKFIFEVGISGDAVGYLAKKYGILTRYKIKVAHNLKDMSGDRFGRLEVLYKVDITLTRHYTTHRKLGNTASLDRIDSKKGYTIDNIQWVHREVNMLRNKHSIDKFLNWVEKIYEYRIGKSERSTTT